MDFLIKNPIIVFFRDRISGGWYFIYIILCIFAILAIMGIVGDRKRKAIEEKLKEKKRWAIESGEEARRAAMESKQVLDVMEENQPNPDDSIDEISDLTKKEEAPSVLVIDADGNSNVKDEKTSS